MAGNPFFQKMDEKKYRGRGDFTEFMAYGSTLHSNVGSSPPPHAADCNSLYAHLRPAADGEPPMSLLLPDPVPQRSVAAAYGHAAARLYGTAHVTLGLSDGIVHVAALREQRGYGRR